jgi:hypothetical protein
VTVTTGSHNEWQGNHKDDENNLQEEDKDKDSSSNNNNNSNHHNTKRQGHQLTTPVTPRAIALWPKFVGAKWHWSTRK